MQRHLVNPERTGLAVEARNLTKYYGSLLAVDHISFEVREGEIFGFLGPNGAGKTTTIRMLCGLSKISDGTAYVNGYDVKKEKIKVKGSIGVVPDISNLYPELTCYDNLNFSAEMYGVPKSERKERIMDLLEFFGLIDKKDEKFANLSKGMKRRATIAAALVHEPKLLFLDEPTIGLDVMGKRKMWRLIEQLNKKGLTIFLTTHNINEASKLSHRLAIINKGKIVAEGTPSDLKKLIPGSQVLELKITPFENFNEEMANMEGVVKVDFWKDGTVRIVAKDAVGVLQKLLRRIVERGLSLELLSLRGAEMEEVFIKLLEE
ncbi:MAG TPA: ATP-binding cassette domain-containing protein [Candidatus Korarchaeota archaeon]|nr:ATP-binding cassette domain-containing protein [Candidatus Korarchaeota archaeon]